MREKLDTLVDELKKLKKQGHRSVLLEPETLEKLEEAAKQVAAKAVQPDPAPPQTSTNDTQAAGFELDSEPEKHKPTPPPTSPLDTPPQIVIPEGSKQEKWDWLRDKVLNCEICNSHVKAGKKVVFGVGSIDADIFFCGEAPGAEEESKGEPFVGPAGQLLTKIIQTMGLERSSVYIGNIMNWRPETETPYGNRPPTVQEMNFCLPYLRAQVEIIKPKVIVALGATAVNGLLGYDPKRSITKARGQWHEFESTPTLISFHPSYVLRNGTLTVKRQIWEDMLAVMERLEMPISDRQRQFFKS